MKQGNRAVPLPLVPKLRLGTDLSVLKRRGRETRAKRRRIDQDCSDRGYATHMPNSLNPNTIRLTFSLPGLR